MNRYASHNAGAPRAGRGIIRLGLLLVSALALLFGLYVAAINVFFATPLFEKIVDSDPLVLDVHYARAWSILPGRIHAKNLSIRGRDANVEWLLRIDDVEFDIFGAGLLRRRFDVSRVRGRGVSLRLRSRIDAPSVTPEGIADLPPIVGFGNAPIRPFQECSEDERDDAAYHLWTVHLADVVADGVREVWIDHRRFEGDALAVGSFYLKPIRAAWVGPVDADVRHGQVLEGPLTIADDLAGRAEVTVSRFDPRRHDDPVIGHVSVQLDGHADVPNVMHIFRSPRARAAADSLEVPVAVTHVHRLAVRLKNGLLQEGSRIEADVPRWVALQGGHRLTGALSVAADLGSSDKDEPLTVRLTLKDLSFDPPLVRASNVGITAAARVTTKLGDPMEVAHLSVALESRLLQSRWHDLEVAAGVRSNVRLLDLRPDEGELRVESAVCDFDGISVRRRQAAASPPALSADRVLVQAHSQRMRIANPLAGLEASASLVNARLHDLLGTGDPDERGRLDALVNVAADAADGKIRAGAQVNLSGASVRWRDARIAGDAQLIALAGPSGSRRGEIEVSGSQLFVRNMTISNTSPSTSQWWGNATLQQARVHLAAARGASDRSWGLDGRLVVEAPNADPLLALFAHGVSPQIVALTQVPHVLASARLSAERGALALRDFEARGGDVQLRGSFSKRESQSLGAFELRKGPLSIGLQVGDGGLGVQLFGLNGWLAREQGEVEQLYRTARRKGEAR